MIRKLATSPAMAESPLATSRMMTRGFPKRRATPSQTGVRFAAAAALLPYLTSRAAASLELRPSSVAASCSSSDLRGCVQNVVAVMALGHRT